ncbi:MAG TPA: poly-beta-hydroxybutyrate polymerase, partial [Burkholderiaceae bacterium]|nr:poly-beta-hydroxybutyrate polymerase [Burkholderiaceae bacterium]
TEVTFVLATGGHNAGVVSPPGHPKSNYRVHLQASGDRYLDADLFLAHAQRGQGSWWPEWQRWLSAHSGPPVAPPSMGAAQRELFVLSEAPGEYVRMK